MRKRNKKSSNRKSGSYPMLKGVIIGLLGGLLLVLGVTFYINDILLPVSELNSDTEDNHGTQNKKPRLSFYDSLLDDGDLTTKAVKRSSIDPPKLPKKYYLQVMLINN